MIATLEDAKKLEDLASKRTEAYQKLREIETEFSKELARQKMGPMGRPQAAEPPPSRRPMIRQRKSGEQDTLKNVIRTILGSSPNRSGLVLKDLTAAVIDYGYVSSAKEFGTVVYQNVKQMMDDGEIAKDEQRKYYLVTG